MIPIIIFITSLFSIATNITITNNDKSKVWISDNGNGTYTNPIIHADYSDPDVCAVGDDFYMTASSFNCTPGLPILHSKDLVNWKLINHAIKELEPKEYYNTPRHGKGIWAPSIRYHNGEFYIYWGDPDFGIFMVKTKDIYGEWSNPVLVKAGKGLIDPCPLWDDDGRVYLSHAWAASRAKLNSIITVCEMNKEGTAVISNPVLVFDGNDGVNHAVEGTKFYKRNNYYYIFAPAGGVATGWQLALRSKCVYGPYEHKIVMAQGETDINGPHQGGWIDTPEGESWFIHFQDKAAYGRVVHLNPMKWINDWPVIGIDNDGDGCGDPVTTYKKPKCKYDIIQTPAESDDFDSKDLGLQWQWHANYQNDFGFTTNMGFYRLYGYNISDNYNNLWDVPNLLLQKFPAEKFMVTTKLKIATKNDGQSSGLVIMGYDYAYIGLEKENDNFLIKYSVCNEAEKGNKENSVIIDSLKINNNHKIGDNFECNIYLRANISKNGVCYFSYSFDNKNYFRIKQSFSAKQGKWIGAKIGIFNITPYEQNKGWTDIDWFIIDKNRK